MNNQEEIKNQAIESMKKNIDLKLESNPRFIMLDGVVLPFLEVVLNKIVPEGFRINKIMLMAVPVHSSKLAIHNPKSQPQMVTMAYTLIEKNIEEYIVSSGDLDSSSIIN